MNDAVYKNRRARLLAKPSSRGVLTGAVALGSVLVLGDRRDGHVRDLADLGGVERELFAVVGGQDAEVAVPLCRRALQVALEVFGGDRARLAPRGVLPDQGQVRGDHLVAADTVLGTDGHEALPIRDLVLPRAAVAGGRLLRGGLGLRRLRVAGRAVVAVVGDEAQDQDGDGQDRDGDVTRFLAVPCHEAGQEATPPVPAPLAEHHDAREDHERGLDGASGGGVDAHVEQIIVRQAVGVGGGGRGGGRGNGLAHGSAPG